MTQTRRFLALLAAALLTGACRGLFTTPPEESGVPAAITERSTDERLARGEALFGRHCAVCHGEDGSGRGFAAPYLFPPARDFTQARFRLVSTDNGVPLDRDLVATLRRGMPGSAMPSWDWLPEEDLWCLAAHVRRLAREGLAKHLLADALERGEEASEGAARELARARTTPGKRLPAVAMAPADAETLERGRHLFLVNCAGCHGADGSGEREPRWNEDGSLNWARDFTAGYLKGGASHEELVWRIQAGLPGTAMVPAELGDPADVAALVAYLRTLISKDAESALVQRRESLRVQRTAGTLPVDPDDPRWEESDVIQFALAPLWWRKESVLRARARAFHDGSRIAIRVSWPDATGNLTLFTDVERSDAVALQFSAETAPPLFGMGAEGHPTTIWHWKSLRLTEIAGATDLLEPVPHVRADGRIEEVTADVPLYHQLEGVPAVSSRVDSMQVSGVKTVRDAEREPGEVRIFPRWKDGEWAVVFVRSLEPAADGEIAFHPGAVTQTACAIWNGEAGDRGPQKSISIWQELALDR